MLMAYGVREVAGDKYGGEWPPAEFRKQGVWYRAADKPKSDLYREFLPAVNARRVELLDLPKLVAQLVGLERRVGRGGRDSIDHAPGAHDDVANSVAGVVEVVLGKVRWGPAIQMARLHGRMTDHVERLRGLRAAGLAGGGAAAGVDAERGGAGPAGGLAAGVAAGAWLAAAAERGAGVP